MSKQKSIPRMNRRQFRRMQGLVHLCCNYDHGNCLALDNGWDSCVCAQRITYSLSCKWFRAAVLPQDPQLEAELLRQVNQKKCAVCGLFVPKSNRAKYYPDCAAKVHRRQKTESERRRRTVSVKPLANQSFRPRRQGGADTFIGYAIKSRSNIPQITNT